MTDSKALFMVQSPLHIHNAREAIIKFGITHSTFLVVTSKHNAKWAQMMIAAMPVDTECLFCERNDHDIEDCTKGYVQHIRFFRQQSFDFVFFSDALLYIFVDIVNSLQNKNTFLMDDGAGVIPTVHTLKHTGKYFDIRQSTQPERRKQIALIKKKYNIWHLKPCQYNLFTAFDFEPCDKFDVVANPMLGLTYFHEQLNEQDVLVLGVPFVNNGYMLLEKYIEYLLKIKSHYGGKRIFYLPHPREDLTNIRTLIGQANIDLIDTQLTAEKYLISLNIAPAIVCGFYSAALWYIAKFQPKIRVEAHRFHLNDIVLPSSQLMSRSNHLSILDIVDLVYDYYQLRMKVIEA